MRHTNLKIKSMMSLDIVLENLNDLPDSLQKQKSAKTCRHPLLAWDMISMTLKEEKLESLRKLKSLSQEYQWSFDTATLAKSKFDALVVTDLNQKILWASIGFERMTGYKPAEVIGLKPSLLQGTKTEPSTKRKIKKAISNLKGLETALINYKKDGTEYLCHIRIIPLHRENQQVTHFLAVESSI